MAIRMIGSFSSGAAELRAAERGSKSRARDPSERAPPPSGPGRVWFPAAKRRRAALEGSVSDFDLWSMAFVFMLATFIGFDVIRNVSRLLHTPLMSLTNAISAIAVVGSIIIAGEQKTTFATVLGTLAVAASVVNIVSGFLITDRMLRMFKKREPAS